MKWTIVMISLALGHGFPFLASQALAAGNNVLLRHYHAGNILTYCVKGDNGSWHYELQATGVVKKDAAGTYFEEYRWSNPISDRQKVELSPTSLSFRQQLTLDPNRNPALPDLRQVDPRLIGPVTDLMTFYADLWLAAKTGKLTRAGDHFYYRRGTPNSWADGTYVLLGEDSIDFDFTLKTVDALDGAAIVLVRHLPPAKPQIRLSAGWMNTKVADTPNNWVQVRKIKDGKYLAAVGKEIFDVTIKVSLTDGKILEARMNNPVHAMERECEDEALTRCGAPKAVDISRKVAILFEHSCIACQHIKAEYEPSPAQ